MTHAGRKARFFWKGRRAPRRFSRNAAEEKIFVQKEGVYGGTWFPRQIASARGAVPNCASAEAPRLRGPRSAARRGEQTGVRQHLGFESLTLRHTRAARPAFFWKKKFRFIEDTLFFGSRVI